ncbi:MAG: PadR family transcriptional regulator [Francisellaceae bacterium]|jgi:PadR family transcriptional regulator, regulatory protein PadR|nr:PadR family transcriptional regulator [Francisellaceae bacterium]MBT6207905.1 PadR family transcriptional regulator [Francisellaceae bacterium]MBT6539087.1 PadR family transcriptional regulator [Francisellaceae bacterium]
MSIEISNWKTQIRKGYLELCILALIKTKTKMYGSQILASLQEIRIDVKEGTLYPLLKRMSNDKVLLAKWDTKNNSGHPRKYYYLTSNGLMSLASMENEFSKMIEIYETLKER